MRVEPGHSGTLDEVVEAMRLAREVKRKHKPSVLPDKRTREQQLEQVQALRARKGARPLRHNVGLMRKALSFMRAVSGPKASEHTFRKRLALCRACEYLKPHEGKEYCAACGCGKWKLAELSVKLRFANLECPAEKWGAST